MSMRIYYDSADINKIVAVYEPDADYDAHWVTGEGMTKIVDPDGSFVAGVDHRHHKIVGTTITEMSAGEKTSHPLPVVDKTHPNASKFPVRAATAAALPANTRSGNVFTADANGAFAAVDSVTLVLQDRFLDKDHATGANRGIMILTQVGDGSTPAKWQRASDSDTDAALQACATVRVEEGTANGGKTFSLTTANPITVNTTALTFAIAPVDVADLADGTDGELITWDASGVPAAVAAGTSGQVLTSNGAGAAPTFQAAGGGNTLDEAYDQGGAGAGAKIIASDGEVIITIDDGSLPAISASTALVLANTSTTTDDVELSLIAGATGDSIINFGDTADENVGNMTYLHASDTFRLTTALTQRITITGSSFTINETGADHDFRVEGDTLSRMLFLDARAASENIAFLTNSTPNWQSMDRGMFIGDMTTAPTGNPASGIFVWSESGAGKARGGSGTVTTWAPAEPHCPQCGRDFSHEWENEKYGYLMVCMWCLTEEIGDRPYIVRDKNKLGMAA